MKLRPFSSHERGMFVSVDGPSGTAGGEVGADAAVALEGCEGAPAAADFRGELVAADGVL